MPQKRQVVTENIITITIIHTGSTKKKGVFRKIAELRQKLFKLKAAWQLVSLYVWAFSCQRACPKIEYFRNSEQSNLKVQFSKFPT